MKKIILFISVFFILISNTFSDYELEKWSLDLVEKYDFNTNNLDKEITRKEFVETLYLWYKDYKKDRWVTINYDNYKKLDNKKIFKDVDLESDFWKALSYFADKNIFSENEYFNPEWKVNQEVFFILMKRLRIMFSLENCKFHRICEREADEKITFVKGTYYKYVSKILDKSLRKYYNNASDYINAWYKPYLKSNYNFPNLPQTLNWCYAFSVRNILKYKDGIGIYIPKIERKIWKKWNDLWNYPMMSKFDKYAHIEKRNYYNIDTLINSLQAWEPVSISYMLKYYSYKEQKYKYVPHIVAAYSFDEKWIWVAETVKNKRELVPWEDVFKSYWSVKYNRIFKYYYIDKSSWTETEKKLENENNYLLWEY